MSKPKQTCETCKWWAKTPMAGSFSGLKRKATKGECRKRLPVVVSTERVHNPCGLSGSGIRTEWPETGSKAWCGEWDGKDETGVDSISRVLPNVGTCPPMPKCKPPKEETGPDRMSKMHFFGPFVRYLMGGK